MSLVRTGKAAYSGEEMGSGRMPRPRLIDSCYDQDERAQCRSPQPQRTGLPGLNHVLGDGTSVQFAQLERT